MYSETQCDIFRFTILNYIIDTKFYIKYLKKTHIIDKNISQISEVRNVNVGNLMRNNLFATIRQP